MKIQLIAMSILSSSALTLSGISFANNSAEHVANIKVFQNACLGKNEGDDVSFPYRGIIWNGQCQMQFISSQNKDLKGKEQQLNSVCQFDPTTNAVNIEGEEFRGKCALAYMPPMPKSSESNTPQ